VTLGWWSCCPRAWSAGDPGLVELLPQGLVCCDPGLVDPLPQGLVCYDPGLGGAAAQGLVCCDPGLVELLPQGLVCCDPGLVKLLSQGLVAVTPGWWCCCPRAWSALALDTCLGGHPVRRAECSALPRTAPALRQPLHHGAPAALPSQSPLLSVGPLARALHCARSHAPALRPTQPGMWGPWQQGTASSPRVIAAQPPLLAEVPPALA